MKKLFLLIVALMSTIGLYAHLPIAEFTNSHDESFKVVLLVKNDKPYRVSVNCETTNKSNGEIWLKPENVAKFRDALVLLKTKYEEWDETAKTNNITEANKDMPIKFPKVEFVWGHSTTFFANDSFKAKWILKSPAEIVLCTASVTASDNRFANETFVIRFYNVQDIQNLIDALSQDKIDIAINKNENSNLFK